MKTAWTKGLTGQPREEIESGFRASAHIRKRLTELLEDKIEARRVKRVSEDEYSSPNWAFKQADNVGYERAIREIISLLDDKSLKE